MPDQLLGDDRRVANFLLVRLRDLPLDARSDFRHAAINLAIEVFDEFQSSSLPSLRRRDLLSVLQHQGIGKFEILIGLRFIVVGGIRSFGIVAVGSATKLLDAQQSDQSLVIFLSRQLDGRGRRTAIRLG